MQNLHILFLYSVAEVFSVTVSILEIVASSAIILQNLHDVTPNVVAIAVIIERMSCKISFQVSFFIAVSMFDV